MENKYFMYVLLCGDKSLYGGFTINLKHRLHRHQLGQGAKYTRAHLPVKLIFYQTFSNQHDAMHEEYLFKHQSRKNKINYLLKHGVDINSYGLSL